MRDRAGELCSIVGATPWLMEALITLRQVGPKGAYVAAGAVRDTVWSVLTRRCVDTRHADVDVVYHAASESPERAAWYESELALRLPMMRWEVTNQAFVHLWYPVREGHQNLPLASVSEALKTWPETATAVGVRMGERAELEVLAPLGLDDLFDLIVRHNPVRADAAVYSQRVARKQWAERWPELQILSSEH